jgi:hypothetical protein
VPPARMECAIARLEDPGRRFPPWRSHHRGVCAICLLPLVWVGVADLPFFMLLLEDFGLQL